MLTIGIHGGGIADGPDTALLLGFDRRQQSPRGGTPSVPPVAGERCLAHAGTLAQLGGERETRFHLSRSMKGSGIPHYSIRHSPQPHRYGSARAVSETDA
jgi:hypothetical protein